MNVLAEILGFLLLVVPLALLVWAIKWAFIDSRRRFDRRHRANQQYRDRRR